MSFNETTIQSLLTAGVLSQKQVNDFQKKLTRINAKAAKAARQALVDEAVSAVISEKSAGELFKHRSVWEAVGRDEFTRDEVLQSLRNSLEAGNLEKVKLSNNNFQIFWKIPGVAALVPATEVEADTEEAPEAS